MLGGGTRLQDNKRNELSRGRRKKGTEGLEEKTGRERRKENGKEGTERRQGGNALGDRDRKERRKGQRKEETEREDLTIQSLLASTNQSAPSLRHAGLLAS